MDIIQTCSDLIKINKGDTPYDHQPDTFVIQESIGKVFNKNK